MRSISIHNFSPFTRSQNRPNGGLDRPAAPVAVVGEVVHDEGEGDAAEDIDDRMLFEEDGRHADQQDRKSVV